MAELSVQVGALRLQNPVIPASGTFGFGYEFAQWYDLNSLGAICVKGTTLSPRFGNPLPRIAEAPAGVVNAVGLQNPGIDEVLDTQLPRLRSVYAGPIILNVSGFSEAEYAACCQKAAACENVAALEVNVSCPNVHGGGMSFGTDPALAARITAVCRAAAPKKPLFVKLSPNVTDVAEIARACEGAGADGLCLINTLLAMRIDLNTRRPVLANVTGGLSGPAVFPVALRAVWQVYAAVKLPILGMGGIASAEDAAEMLLAGACAVQVGAANLVDPLACKRIVDGLPAVLERLGVHHISELTGGAHHG